MTEPGSAPPAGNGDIPVAPASPRRAILLAAIVALCVGAVYLTPLGDAVASLRDPSKRQWIDDLRARADDAGWPGSIAFTGACGLLVSVGVPRLALAFVGGALYGWIEGAILAQLGTFAGCWATFLAGRHLGRKWVQDLVARRFPRAKGLLDFIARHGFEANLILRLTPVGNCFATNLLFAVSKVRSTPFLVATFLGTAPETVLAALAGSAAKGTETASRLLGAAVGMAVLAVVAGWWVRRRSGRRRTEA